MKWNRGMELRTHRISTGVLAALALLGIIVLLRELPAMRRYLRIKRM